MSSCRGEQAIVDEWRLDGGMDEWSEDIVIRGSGSVYYIWPPHLFPPPTMRALHCLASQIGVHAD